MATTKQRRGGTAAVAVVGVSLLTSCVLREGPEYVVQPAPPSGVHVTIKLGPSSMLKAVSDIVADGGAIDGHLRTYGLPTRCDHYANTRYYGDRCAFDVLGDVEMGGGLAGGASRLYWNDAIADDEFGDFRNDALGRVRSRDNTTCLHATIRNYGDWPVEWRETNWTVRTKAGDSKCR
jgi:hypothetical protein